MTNAVSVAQLGSRGGIILPSWTTATRPSNPIVGQQGYNTTISMLEMYNGSIWTIIQILQGITISYLLIAGGGAGGAGWRGGAGGAGGLLQGITNLNFGSTYNIVIGAGATAPAYNESSNTQGPAPNGGNSTAFGLTAIGGGGGAMGDGNNPSTGGSGGGSWYSSFSGAGQTVGAAGTTGQGYAGGGASMSPYYGGGGGGGAGGVGGNGSTTRGGNGGVGIVSSITGTAIEYAGGGSADIYGYYSTNVAPAPGSASGGGGVGDSRASFSAASTRGTANTGGGGGTGGNGGSGILIMVIPTVFYSGNTTGSPTITTNGLNTIVKFTSSGSYIA